MAYRHPSHVRHPSQLPTFVSLRFNHDDLALLINAVEATNDHDIDAEDTEHRKVLLERLIDKYCRLVP